MVTISARNPDYVFVEHARVAAPHQDAPGIRTAPLCIAAAYGGCFAVEVADGISGNSELLETIEPCNEVLWRGGKSPGPIAA